jgi:pyroglutamyl-peptidase
VTQPIILITGFGPFPGVMVNPTDRLMREVTARLTRLHGPAATGARLEVRYAVARRQVAELMATRKPDAVLLLGLAAKARWVRVERFARLSDSKLHADASGQGGSGPHRASGMPLRSTAALEPALAALRQHGVRARLSPTAGRYLCNAAYAEALSRAAGRPVLFVHVPWPRGHHGPTPRRRIRPWRPSVKTLVQVLIVVARDLAVRTRRAKTGQPPLA